MSDQAASDSARRAFLVRWYASLLAGLVPLLVIGFTVSVLANRLVFLAWAVAMAAAWAVTVRRGFAGGWRPAVLAAAALAVAAVAALLFGVLVARHQESFELGFRAVLPALYRPLLTRPALGYGAAVALGLAAVLTLLAATPIGGRRGR